MSSKQGSISLADYLSRAWQIHQSGNLDAAVQMYRGVLRQMPASAEAWIYLGIAQFDQRDFSGSVQSYRRGIQLKENFPIAWNNLGNSLRMLGEVEEADRCFETALAQQPDYLSALTNRGTLWVWSGEIERGLSWYQRGLEIKPDHAELHRNIGVIRLLMGNFSAGFAEYRWRWKMPGVGRPQLVDRWRHDGRHVPVWSGQPLSGKTITLYPEQGLGDAIQFLRVASACRDEGARVVVICDSAMLPLFSSFADIDALHADLPQTTIAPTDYQATFLEVLDAWHEHRGQLYVGRGEPSGYLRASESHVAYWANWLEQHRPARNDRLRVGINWQGNPDHHADVYRSVPLSALGPLVQEDRFDIVSLQFGAGLQQLDAVDFGDRVLRLPADIDRSGKFTDTAAVVVNLDAIVTSDTSLAHLSGALGQPTHVMLGRVPDWRWRLRGERTPWYPTMRLHRQIEFSDWSGVVSSIRDVLSGGNRV